MEIIKLKISDIKPYAKNPRKNDNAVDAVAESIKQCGYCSPIIIDENNVILCGHTRLKALKKLGYKEAECVKKEGMTEDQKKKYRILDNKTSELAEWDFDLLGEELQELDFGGFDFGLDTVLDYGKFNAYEGEHVKLKDKYIVPPFSVLNTRDGEWQERKRQWGEIIKSSDGRDDGLLGEGLNRLAKMNNIGGG